MFLDQSPLFSAICFNFPLKPLHLGMMGMMRKKSKKMINCHNKPQKCGIKSFEYLLAAYLGKGQYINH